MTFYPAGSSGGVKIRPIRLPQREKVSSTDDDDAGDKSADSAKRPASDVRRSNPGSSSGSSNAAAKKTQTSTSAPALPQKRPRICIRLVRLLASNQGILKGKYHCTIDLLFDWSGISCMTTDILCFYLKNRVIQTSQTGGQWYSDTSPLVLPVQT